MTKTLARRGVAMDSLEPRRLLSLTLFGSAIDDVIRVTSDGGDLVVFTNGVEARYAGADGLVLDAGSGADTVRLDHAGGLPITLIGGAGDDRFEIGAGDLAAATLRSVSVVGGAGLDTLVIDDSAATAGLACAVIDNPYDVFVSTTLPGNLGVIVADASNAHDAVESLLFRGGAGNDAITVFGTHARVAVALETGGGDDAVTFGTDIDSRLRGPLSVDGGEGVNRLTVDDSADAFADTYILGGVGATGTVRKDSGGSTLSYTRVNDLTLWAGSGGSVPNNQQFRTTYVPAVTSATIFAGTGDDTLWFGDGVASLDDFHAGLVFAGQDGVDRINYNDAVGRDAATYGVSPIAITNAGTGPVVYFDTEALNVRGNDADNLIRLSATGGTTNVTLNGGGGDDRFEVGAGDLDGTLANSVSVVGGAGTDTLAIDDTRDDGAGDNAYTFSNGLLLRTLKAVLWSTDAAGRTESVSLAGSAHADVVRVSSASPGVALRMDAGDGDDAFYIDRTTDGNGSAPAVVTVASGAGHDALDVNSDGANADAAVAIDGGREELDALRVRAGGRLELRGGAASLLRVDGPASFEGRLDVGTATLIVRAADLATIAGHAGSGTGDGTSAGIFSSASPASPARTAVAVVRAATIGTPTFEGVATSGDDVVVRYTLAGDANLDRTVGFDDLLAFAQHYGQTGAGWAEGNFDQDAAGAVGFDDLLALAQNYGASIG